MFVYKRDLVALVLGQTSILYTALRVTNVEVENHLFVEGTGHPRGHCPLP